MNKEGLFFPENNILHCKNAYMFYFFQYKRPYLIRHSKSISNNKFIMFKNIYPL